MEISVGQHKCIEKNKLKSSQIYIAAYVFLDFIILHRIQYYV